MKKCGVLAGLVTMLATGAALACEGTGLPDLDLCVVTWHAGSGTTATLLVVPDGSGAPLTAARRPDGMLVDATIELLMVDACGDFIFNFPSEDLWLESTDDGLALCAGGSVADHNVDRQGRTVWTQPLRAGGHSQAACQVLINGLPVAGGGGLPLHFNSPDLNGDRGVSLVDIVLFAEAYSLGSYVFAADLHADGAVNIADIGVMAAGVGAGCP